MSSYRNYSNHNNSYSNHRQRDHQSNQRHDRYERQHRSNERHDRHDRYDRYDRHDIHERHERHHSNRNPGHQNFNMKIKFTDSHSNRNRSNHSRYSDSSSQQGNLIKRHRNAQDQRRNGNKKKIDNDGNQVNLAYNLDSSLQMNSQTDQSGVIKFVQENEKQKFSEKDVVPWLSNKTASIKDSLLRFHNQIIEFYNYLKPSKKSHDLKLKKFNYIKQKILDIFPNVQVLYFGSFATQLYLPDGDIDVSVITNGNYQKTQVYNKIDKFLQSRSNANIFTNVEYIRKSKVPLIKFEYEGIHFDISVDKSDGISQIKYVNQISQIFPQFKYLTFVFKCALRIRGLSDTYTGGIGSFLLSCMLLYYLKTTHEKGNYFNLGQHVLQFMKFYAINQDKWKRKVIYIKELKEMDREFDGCFLSCVSPQDKSHDIGRSAFKIKDVFSVLRNRCRYILDKNFAPKQSILRVLINPADGPFRYLKQKQT